MGAAQPEKVWIAVDRSTEAMPPVLCTMISGDR